MLSSAIDRDYPPYDFRRRYERKSYDAYIVFVSEGQVFQGNLKDISVGGAFIQSQHAMQLVKGANVTISVPFTNGRRHVKRTGRILWKNSSGFAITFYP